MAITSVRVLSGGRGLHYAACATLTQRMQEQCATGHAVANTIMAVPKDTAGPKLAARHCLAASSASGGYLHRHPLAETVQANAV